jgi:hypothetical protein
MHFNCYATRCVLAINIKMNEVCKIARDTFEKYVCSNLEYAFLLLLMFTIQGRENAGEFMCSFAPISTQLDLPHFGRALVQWA